MPSLTDRLRELKARSDEPTASNVPPTRGTLSVEDATTASLLSVNSRIDKVEDTVNKFQAIAVNLTKDLADHKSITDTGLASLGQIVTNDVSSKSEMSELREKVNSLEQSLTLINTCVESLRLQVNDLGED